MKNSLITPAKIFLTIALPMVMVFLITILLACMISLITPATFTDVTTNGVLIVVNFLMYIGFLISTGEWLFNE
jgi:hypothetical protein